MTAAQHINREAWLNAFVAAAGPQFESVGNPIPGNVRVSVGFTSRGKRGSAIGECWGKTSTKDGHFEIFIRPSIESDSRIADVLTHELVHAAVGLEAKHGIVFKRCATALGLEGKMTATVGGVDWRAWASPILKALGPMPGSPLDEGITLTKTQTTRMLKCVCGDCGFIFRTCRKNLDDNDGSLTCAKPGCGGDVQEA